MPAGGPRPLEAEIERKDYVAADGTRTAVLEGMRFALAAGSFTCLIGPSGCGKTTTLRILLGLDPDFKGHVRLPSPTGRLSAVFQEPRLLPWRSVERNVRLALAGDPVDEVELTGLFETLGLGDVRTRYPGELSLGMERRVALARAFAVKPDILLLDEPFVSLDEHTAARLRALLVTLWKRQSSTVLMVTHNLREAAAMADRLLLLKGRPASVEADLRIPFPREQRQGPEFDRFLADLVQRHPETLRL